jgi:hypothetical protein
LPHDIELESGRGQSSDCLTCGNADPSLAILAIEAFRALKQVVYVNPRHAALDKQLDELHDPGRLPMAAISLVALHLSISKALTPSLRPPVGATKRQDLIQAIETLRFGLVEAEHG